MLGRTNVGGGAGLNFKVVGGTVQPINPKENTLWINTDVDIESWTFAAENPYIKSEDFYSEGEVKAGYYLKNDGAETAGSNYEICTIELPSTATSFTVTAGSTSTTTVCHVFYDADGEMMSAVNRQTGRNTFAIPSGAASVRVSLRDEDTKAVEITYEDGATEGAVWIPTGSSSLTPFNALKKNNVTVYPMKCAQFVSGAWTDKNAAIYQAGAWVDLWNGKLYDYGDEYEPVTGGFVEAYKNSIGTRTFTKNEDSLYFKSTGTTSGGAHIYASTEKKINLNSFSTLYARIKHSPSSGTSFYLAAHTRNDEPVYDVPCVLRQSSSKEGIVSLDISGLSGEHYILLGLGGNAASNSGSCYVYEVYLT